jgi:hypothetical protein
MNQEMKVLFGGSTRSKHTYRVQLSHATITFDHAYEATQVLTSFYSLQQRQHFLQNSSENVTTLAGRGSQQLWVGCGKIKI